MRRTLTLVFLVVGCLLSSEAFSAGCSFGSMCGAYCNQTAYCEPCWSNCCTESAGADWFCNLQVPAQCHCTSGGSVTIYAFCSEPAGCNLAPRPERPDSTSTADHAAAHPPTPLEDARNEVK